MSKLKVKQLFPGEGNPIHTVLGISNSRADELIDLTKDYFKSEDTITATMEEMTKNNDLTVNELAFSMFILGSAKVRIDEKRKEAEKDAGKRIRELFKGGVSEKDLEEMEDTKEEDLPEMLQKANMEVKNFLQSDESDDYDVDETIHKVKRIFDKYGIVADVNADDKGVAISVDRDQFNKVATSIDDALEKLSEARLKGNTTLVEKLEKYLSENI